MEEADNKSFETIGTESCSCPSSIDKSSQCNQNPNFLNLYGMGSADVELRFINYNNMILGKDLLFKFEVAYLFGSASIDYFSQRPLNILPTDKYRLQPVHSLSK